jgi:hypothetical protein
MDMCLSCHKDPGGGVAGRSAEYTGDASGIRGSFASFEEYGEDEQADSLREWQEAKATADPYGMTARKARARSTTTTNAGISPLRITKTKA